MRKCCYMASNVPTEWKDSACLYRIVDYLQLAVSELEKHNWSREEFLEDSTFQNVCSFYAIQIGENVKNLSQNFREIYPNSFWKDLAGMRDIYAHAYHRFNENIAWDSLTKDYPEILKKCLKICEENGWEVPPPPVVKTKPKKLLPIQKIMSAYDDLERITDNAPEKFKALVRKVLKDKKDVADKNKNNGR